MHQRRHGAVVAPTANFGVPIGEGEAARQMMVKTGKIVEAVLSRLVRPAGHSGGEVAHVDAVLTHIEKNKYLCRTGIKEFGLLQINFIITEWASPVAISSSPPAQEYIHGHAADTGFGFRPDNHAGAVRGALPNRKILAAVRPHRTFLDGDIRVPI